MIGDNELIQECSPDSHKWKQWLSIGHSDSRPGSFIRFCAVCRHPQLMMPALRDLTGRCVKMQVAP